MKKFGIEIEIYLNSIEELKQELQKDNIDFIQLEAKSHKVNNILQLVPDITLTKHEKDLNLQSIELNLPPSEDFILLEKVCNVLQKINAQPILNCALHIHIDFSDKTIDDVKNVFYWYKEHEEEIKLQVKNIQPNNKFNLNKDIASLDKDFDDIRLFVPKMYNLNIKPYYNRQTLEHRIFSGTINFEEIRRCVEFTQDILTYEKII